MNLEVRHAERDISSVGSVLCTNMACARGQRLSLVSTRAAADLDGVERARAGRVCSAWWAFWRRGRMYVEIVVVYDAYELSRMPSDAGTHLSRALNFNERADVTLRDRLVPRVRIGARRETGGCSEAFLFSCCSQWTHGISNTWKTSHGLGMLMEAPPASSCTTWIPRSSTRQPRVYRET
jgi:hypothetical protein